MRCTSCTPSPFFSPERPCTKNKKLKSSWWFQPIWKIWVKLDHFLKYGMKIKNVWNNHPEIRMLHSNFENYKDAAFDCLYSLPQLFSSHLINFFSILCQRSSHFYPVIGFLYYHRLSKFNFPMDLFVPTSLQTAHPRKKMLLSSSHLQVTGGSGWGPQVSSEICHGGTSFEMNSAWSRPLKASYFCSRYILGGFFCPRQVVNSKRV